MERIEHYLGSGEQVVYASRQHPVALLKPLAWWLATMIAVTVAGTFVLARTDAPLAQQLIGAVVIGVTGYAVVRVLHWWATRYVITRERVIMINGLVSVRVSSLPLSKVNDTTLSRSLWGRLLGYGDLTLESAGERAGLSRLIYLPKPKDAYRLVSSLLAERDRREGDVQRSRQWPGITVAGKDDTGPLPRFG